MSSMPDSSSSADSEPGVVADETQILEKKKDFIDGVDSILEGIKNKLYNLKLIYDVAARFGAKFDSSLRIDNAIFDRAFDTLGKIVAEEEDIRICGAYLNLLRAVFIHVEDDQAALKYAFSGKEVPLHLHKYYKNYQSEMAQITNAIHEPNSFSDDQKVELARRLSYLLLISAKATIRRLLVFCIEMKPLVPSVVLVLERIPVILHFQVKTAIKIGSRNWESIFVTMFRRFLSPYTSQCEDGLSPEKMPDFEYLLLTLTRTRLKDNSQTKPQKVLQKASIEATVLIEQFLIDQLSRGIQMHFLLGLLNKMFVLSPNRTWKISWKKEDSPDQPETFIDQTELLLLLVRIYVDHSSDEKLCSFMPLLLQSFATKLREDQAPISAKNTGLFEKLDQLDWTLGYCITEWFSIFNRSTKIPFCLYEKINSQARENFEPIGQLSPANRKVDDQITKLFALGLISSVSAINLLENVITIENASFIVEEELQTISKNLLKTLNTEAPNKSMESVLPLVEYISLMRLNAPKEKKLEPEFDAKHKLLVASILSSALHLFIRDQLVLAEMERDGVEKKNNKIDFKLFSPRERVILNSFCEYVLPIVHNEFSIMKKKIIAKRKKGELSSSSDQQPKSTILFCAANFCQQLYGKIENPPPNLRILKKVLDQQTGSSRRGEKELVETEET